MTPAQSILVRPPYPRTWAERLARAREIISATGDLPEAIWYELWFGQDEVEQEQAARELADLRPANTPAYKLDRI